MTSSPFPREDIALLHQAATVLRKRYRRLQAEDGLAGRPWGTTADYGLLDRAVELDKAARALGRGELEESRRAAVVEEAKAIVADTGG